MPGMKGKRRMNKITILGDIVCDGEMLKAARIGKNKYNFDSMFQPLKSYLRKSDYVVANLETPISDTGLKYTSSVFSFNNPESLLKTLKEIGIDAVSLANNHILDRSIKGIESTINLLDKHKIKYFGVTQNGKNDGNLYIDLPHAKVCVLGYTDSTNYHVNKCMIDSSSNYEINLLKPQNLPIKRRDKNIFYKLYHKLNPNIRIRINNLLKIKIKPIVDNCSEFDELPVYMNPLYEKIVNSKIEKYFTIFYPHMGGQFNIIPGSYTLKMMEKFEGMGCNSVVVTHPHIIQKMRFINDCSCFYSTGGVVISPTSKFVLWETKPQYSVAVNYYFEHFKLVKLTISFFICVKDQKSYLKVYPFYEYYNSVDESERIFLKEDIIQIYNRLFSENYKDLDIKEEYVIKEYNYD